LLKHSSHILFPRKKSINFLIVLGLYFIGLLLVFFLKPSYLLNILIVYLPGLIYLFFIIKKSRKKILIFGLLSLLFIIPVEILARLTDSWDVLSQFPRILGIAPIENIVYALINILYPLCFYEFFYDEDRNEKISRNWKYLLGIFLSFFILVFSLYFIFPDILKLNYWIIGICIYFPVFILLIKYKRHIVKRLIVVGLVLGIMYGLHELLSMYLGHWWWPGNYLMPINIGGYIYPLDDLIIWLVFSNVAVISGYEVMWD